MKQSLLGTLTLALACATLGCSDSGAPGSTPTDSDAFSTLPIGFAEVQSTFGDERDDGTTEWTPRSHGSNSKAAGQLVFGGLNKFLKFSFVLRPFRNEASDNCAFDAGSSRVQCELLTRGGLTVSRSAAFADAQGHVQQTFDRVTTNSVNVQLDVAGIKDRGDGNHSTVHHHSDYTVTGLAQGSADLTVNGESAGQETTTGTDDVGDFTAERKIGDEVEDLVLPEGRGRPFPASGKITRSAQVTITYAGQAPKMESRREVITFTGSSTATVEITRNGDTRTCTISPTDGVDCR